MQRVFRVIETEILNISSIDIRECVSAWRLLRKQRLTIYNVHRVANGWGNRTWVRLHLQSRNDNLRPGRCLRNGFSVGWDSCMARQRGSASTISTKIFTSYALPAHSFLPDSTPRKSQVISPRMYMKSFPTSAHLNGISYFSFLLANMLIWFPNSSFLMHSEYWNYTITSPWLPWLRFFRA
jgi:hypothetical protein